MIWIEDYPCNTLREAELREQYFIDELKPTMNTQKAHRTKEQYKEYRKDHYQDNKETYLERQKEYYQEKKETISKKAKEKFECECGGKFTRNGKSIHFKTKKHQDWCKLIQS